MFCKDTFAFEFLIKQGLQMFVTFLRTKNVDVKSHMSTLGADEIAMVKANFAGKYASA